MVKKVVLASFIVATLIAIASFSALLSDNQTLACVSPEKGVVDKTPCEAFTAKIGFKNTGSTEGTWTVNVAFEGEKWMWSGTPQTLTLKQSKTKTLTWNGSVPCDAPTDSVARLIVYYNDSFTPLDWWIHVVSAAELTITTSTVQ